MSTSLDNAMRDITLPYAVGRRGGYWGVDHLRGRMATTDADGYRTSDRAIAALRHAGLRSQQVALYTLAYTGKRPVRLRWYGAALTDMVRVVAPAAQIIEPAGRSPWREAIVRDADLHNLAVWAHAEHLRIFFGAMK